MCRGGEGGGGDVAPLAWASARDARLSARPPPLQSHKAYSPLLWGPVCYFFSIWGPSCNFFIHVWSLFCLYGGLYFGLATPTKIAAGSYALHVGMQNFFKEGADQKKDPPHGEKGPYKKMKRPYMDIFVSPYH